MPQVTFIQSDGSQQTVQTDDGQTILQTAHDNDINMDNACGGNGVCTTCMVKVKEGMGNLNEATDAEDMMGITGEPDMRLGCQAEVKGDVTVEIMF